MLIDRLLVTRFSKIVRFLPAGEHRVGPEAELGNLRVTQPVCIVSNQCGVCRAVPRSVRPCGVCRAVPRSVRQCGVCRINRKAVDKLEENGGSGRRMRSKGRGKRNIAEGK
jgi:hypothetical protein